MKRFFIAALLLSSLVKAQTNTMLNGDFWKKNPAITIVKAEIEKGNNPAEANGGNHDVVSMAINNGADFETIKFLISQPGNSVDKNTHDGRQYIHWAAYKGNLELVKYLIEKGSDLNKTDDKGATPLAFAAGNGLSNPEIYDLFFKAGINPKQKYNDGANILLLGIANDKDLALTNYLSKKGLSLKDTDDLGRTTFDYATKTGNIELLNTLLKKGIKPTGNSLIIASQGSRSFNNNLETYKYLVEEVKVDPKSKGINGETVLHNLAKKPNQAEIINYFLSKGVDPNTTNKNGNNVLMEASASNNVDVVKTILAKTKDVNAKNINDETALFFATLNGSPEIVNYLIANGAKTTINAKNGNLAYYLVQSYKPTRPGDKNNIFEEKLTILKNGKVNFTEKLNDGSTLYHAAVVKNDIDLLKALNGLNIDINATNEDGLTALHRAAMVAKDDQILKYLLSLGANKKSVTEFDETAYDLASENEYLKENNIKIDFLK